MKLEIKEESEELQEQYAASSNHSRLRVTATSPSSHSNVGNRYVPYGSRQRADGASSTTGIVHENINIMLLGDSHVSSNHFPDCHHTLKWANITYHFKPLYMRRVGVVRSNSENTYEVFTRLLNEGGERNIPFVYLSPGTTQALTTPSGSLVEEPEKVKEESVGLLDDFLASMRFIAKKVVVWGPVPRPGKATDWAGDLADLSARLQDVTERRGHMFVNVHDVLQKAAAERGSHCDDSLPSDTWKDEVHLSDWAVRAVSWAAINKAASFRELH